VGVASICDSDMCGSETMKSKFLAGAAGASIATALLVRYTLRVPLTDAIREPRLIVSVPSLWAGVSAVAIGVLVGILVGRYLARVEALDALTPLLIPALAAGVYVPGALFWVPSLCAFSGRFLDVILLGTSIAALWRLATKLELSLPLTSNRLAVFAFALFFGLGLHLQNTVGLSGDEPHYLLIAYSLLNDGDLEVENNYVAGDHRRFYDGKIGPHLAHGSAYSVHGVGLPLLLLPGFALLGLRGVLLTEALWGALLVREVYLTAEGVSGDRKTALVAAVGFGFTVPALFLNVSAYPEVPAALVVVAAIRRMWFNTQPNRRQAFIWGLAFGLLPFLHVKFLLLTAVLGLGAMSFWPKRCLWVAAGLATGVISVVAYFALLLGNPNPLASYGRQRVFIDKIPLGVLGLLFDQEFGLLPASPFYGVALIGLGTMIRREMRPALLTLGVLAAVAVPGAAHPLWTGGTSPPARFLFPALPLLAVAAAAMVGWEPRRGAAPWARPLLVASLCLAFFMALGPGQPLYLNQRDGTGRLWEALGSSWDLTHYLPSLVRADWRSVVMAVGAGVFLLAGALLHWSRRRLSFPSVVIPVLLYVLLLDWTFPGRPSDQAGVKWMVSLLGELSHREDDRLLLLPAAESLSHVEALESVDIPITVSEGTDADDWRSPSFYLPAGNYRLEGGSSGSLRVCNGRGCLGPVGSGGRFATRVALARFHLRGDSRRTGLRLRAQKVGPSPFVARRSLRLDSGVNVHALDDRVYLDPKGFWVHAGGEARFALEGEEGTTGRLALANGGRENWVEIDYGGGETGFTLGPWEKRTLEIPLERGIVLFSVTSRSGFRPSDIDPGSTDSRALGVFLTSPRL
jgi:hypothetical protein